MTPKVWLAPTAIVDGIINVAATPHVVQLANGFSLIGWHDSTFDGTHAVMLDAYGNKITGDIGGSFGFSTGRVTSISALDDGGFMVLRETDLAGGGHQLEVHTYNFDAPNLAITPIHGLGLFGAANQAKTLTAAASAAASAESAVVVYALASANGADNIFLRHVDPADGTTVGPQVKLRHIDAAVGASISGLDVDTFDAVAGTFVVAWSEQLAGNDKLRFRIVDAAGSTITKGTTSGKGTISDVDVATLAGGGFALSWTQDEGNGSDENVRYRVYDEHGAAVAGAQDAITTTAGRQEFSALTALDDGGFVIVWSDLQTHNLRGQAFDSLGGRNGSEFDAATLAVPGSLGLPALVTLADGRLLSAWNDTATIGYEILDSRLSVNPPVALYPSAYQFGTPRGDAFVVDPVDGGFVFGGPGKDTITDGAGAQSIDAGDGRDVVLATSDLALDVDSFVGGRGFDIIDWSLTNISNVTFDLAAGTATDTVTSTSESMTQFEGLVGTPNPDTIMGSVRDNELHGGNGNDLIDGITSDNDLFGDKGTDTLISGPGADHLDGGSGNDWADYSRSEAGVTIILNTASASGGYARLDTLVSIEKLKGSDFADQLTGDGGENTLNGLGGADVLQGLNGDDRLNGGGGSDRLTGGMGADALNGNGGNDTFIYSSVGESAVGGTRDIINDFQPGSDTIDLTGIDADITGGGPFDPFDFIGTDTFSNVAGELRYRFEGGNTLVEGDVDGDGAADLQIELVGEIALLASDFLS